MASQVKAQLILQRTGQRARRCLVSISLVSLVLVCDLSVAIGGSASSNAWGKAQADPCETILPQSLKSLLTTTYPEYRVVTLSMLEGLHQSDYLKHNKNNKNGCPGVTKVRFFDKLKVDYAIAITKGPKPNVLTNVLLAKKGMDTAWDLTTLEADVNGTPAVMTLPSNKYTGDVEEGVRTLDSKHEVIFVVYYESSSLVYALTERGIEHVWLSD